MADRLRSHRHWSAWGRTVRLTAEDLLRAAPALFAAAGRKDDLCSWRDANRSKGWQPRHARHFQSRIRGSPSLADDLAIQSRHDSASADDARRLPGEPARDRPVPGDGRRDRDAARDRAAQLHGRRRGGRGAGPGVRIVERPGLDLVRVEVSDLARPRLRRILSAMGAPAERPRGAPLPDAMQS